MYMKVYNSPDAKYKALFTIAELLTELLTYL